MIIISLFGGLGNQMFQYACGKAVATRLGVELKLDTSLVNDRTPRENFTYRDYELGVFNVDDKIATMAEVREFTSDLWNSSKYVQQFFRLKRFFSRKSLFVEKQKFIYNKPIEFVSDNSYLYGYFQTEKYFDNFRSELLQLFGLRQEIDGANAEIIEQMTTCNAVSLHVRRGDYVNSPFTLLEVDDYYRKAVDLILSRVDSPVFYIFTNDYDWVVENFAKLNINNQIVNINSGNQSYLDLILMSKCKHNICANSSFSWWGAWLNTNPNKLVVTPRKWFKNDDKAMLNADLIPRNWLSV